MTEDKEMEFGEIMKMPCFPIPLLWLGTATEMSKAFQSRVFSRRVISKPINPEMSKRLLQLYWQKENIEDIVKIDGGS